MRTDQVDEAPVLEGVTALNSSGMTYDAMQAASSTAIEGIVRSTYNMPIIKRILYPEPREREVLSCCFMSLCLFSMIGCLTGTTLTSLSAYKVYTAPELVRAIFTVPAYAGWLIGFCCSAMGMYHYRCKLAPLPPRRNMVLGTPVQQNAEQNNQPQADLSSGNNVGADQSTRVEATEEHQAEIRQDIGVVPSGYAPPVIPSPGQML